MMIMIIGEEIFGLWPNASSDSEASTDKKKRLNIEMKCFNHMLVSARAAGGLFQTKRVVEHGHINEGETASRE